MEGEEQRVQLFTAKKKKTRPNFFLFFLFIRHLFYGSVRARRSSRCLQSYFVPGSRLRAQTMGGAARVGKARALASPNGERSKR